MSLPERRGGPYVPPPAHVEDLGDQKAVERSSRSGWRWWWVLPVVVALGIWWAGWGFAGSGGWWWGNVRSQNTAIPTPPGAQNTQTLANAGATPPPNGGAAGAQRLEAQQMTGPGVHILDANNKQSFIGKPFSAQDVPVQKKVNDRTLWIGGAGGAPMLAIVKPSVNLSGIDVAQAKVIDGAGTVEKAPSEAQAKSQWSLSAQDADRLKQEGVYIELSQLAVPPQR